jgi:hypothetical protein
MTDTKEKAAEREQPIDRIKCWRYAVYNEVSRIADFMII